MDRSLFTMRGSNLVCFSLLFLFMASNQDPCAATPNSASVHIVYTERPAEGEEEAFHVRTLASVLGSEDAAKDAIIYSYKNAASGFSAKLTAQQVSEISKLPSVLQVVPDMMFELHGGSDRLN